MEGLCTEKFNSCPSLLLCIVYHPWPPHPPHTAGKEKLSSLPAQVCGLRFKLALGFWGGWGLCGFLASLRLQGRSPLRAVLSSGCDKRRLLRRSQVFATNCSCEVAPTPL